MSSSMYDVQAANYMHIQQMADPANQTQGQFANLLISPTMEVNVDSCASIERSNDGNQQNNNVKGYGAKKLKKNKSGVSS